MWNESLGAIASELHPVMPPGAAAQRTLRSPRHASSKIAGIDRRLLLMHQTMLGDAARLAAYDRAFAETIRPGDTVVDVGAGMLILSLLALRHGARHVYAVEADPQTALLAREIVKRNALTDRLTVIEADARQVDLPVPADVIVAEMMGNLGPEEEMADIVGEVARRNLRPRGRIVPQRLTTSLMAIEFDRDGWGVWQQDFWGYCLDVVQDYADAAAQLHFFSRPPILLSAPMVVADSTLGAACEPIAGAGRQLTITAAGSLQGLVGYFTATLSPSVTLANFPSYPGCNWATWIWPLRHTAVVPNDTIEVAIELPADIRLATDWRLNCRLARTGTRP
jgi:hypothetical protein